MNRSIFDLAGQTRFVNRLSGQNLFFFDSLVHRDTRRTIHDEKIYKPLMGSPQVACERKWQNFSFVSLTDLTFGRNDARLVTSFQDLK